MTTRHTPGPWYCIGGAVYRENDATAPIAYMCRDERASEAGIYPVERDCNARLIAAAPELLAACREALIELKDAMPHDEWELAYRVKVIARAIIKAEGGAE